MSLQFWTKWSIFVTNVVIMEKYSSKDSTQGIASEPEAFYRLENKYDRISSILGAPTFLETKIHSDLDLIEISRKGLPKFVVYRIGELLNVSMDKMSSLLHVSHRTIQRKSDKDLLNTYSSEQILEIAEVISRGIEVLGTIEAFTAWCHAELPGLGYKKPIDFLDTTFGTNMVLATLGRIEYGVFA